MGESVPRCDKCKGTGFIVLPMDTQDLPDGLAWQTLCPDCEGTGLDEGEDEVSDEAKD